MASMILLGLALVAGNTFPYTLLGLGAASLTVYAAHRQTPSYRLGRVEDAIIATEKIRQHAEANGARDQVQWMEYAKRLLDAKLSASKIQTRLLEARRVKTWGEYLEKVKEILQSIDECAKDVKDIQTSYPGESVQNCRVWIIELKLSQLTIEAEQSASVM
ncbi:hypothetical protein B0H14DRAFT_59182 [Mycena olivaceomarginata]|nr:hypothetical protein B0H14DRAFT_59182 [Mycena olivaceomarginata]